MDYKNQREVKMKLKEYRKKEHLTQMEVAKALGVRQGIISAWELGNRTPSSTCMKKIIAYTNGEVQPNDFYGVSNEE